MASKRARHSQPSASARGCGGALLPSLDLTLLDCASEVMT